MEPLVLSTDWEVPASDLSVRFVRSGGPGGQNVNKLATKAELRFALDATSCLTDGQKARLRALYPSAVTQSGELVLFGDEHRSQAMNLEATRQRLKSMILRARRPPRVRRPTQPTRAAKKRRREDKRKRSDLKRQRRAPFD